MEIIFDLILILIAHFVMDFVLQHSEITVKKSYDMESLCKHVAIYSFGMFIMLYKFIPHPFMFIAITYLTHFFIDLCTSKLNAYLWKNKIYGKGLPNLGFFSAIGFDQLLHQIQLLLTYLYVMQ